MIGWGTFRVQVMGSQTEAHQTVPEGGPPWLSSQVRVQNDMFPALGEHQTVQYAHNEVSN